MTTMTSERTVAKTGRSTKNFANTSVPLSFGGRGSRRGRGGGGRGGARRLRHGLRRRVDRLDGVVDASALEPEDDQPVLLLHALALLRAGHREDHPHAVVEE